MGNFLKRKIGVFLRFAFALAALALITACPMNTDEEEEDPSNYEGNYEGDQYPDRAAAAEKTNVLGWGYDLTKEYARLTGGRGYQVLDSKKLDQEGRILREQPNSLTITATSGSDFSEYVTNLSNSVTASVSGGYGPASFSGEAGQDERKARAQSSLYAFSTIRARAETDRFTINGNAATLQSYLTSEFTNAVANETPARLIELYGTHVMLGGVWGGKVEYQYTFMKKTDVTAADVSNMAKISAEASFGAAKLGLGLSTEQKTSTQSKFETQNTTISYIGEGGNIGDSYQGFANEGNLTAWANSLNTNNASWIDFYPNQLYLLPLDDFIADAAKKAAVKSAISSYFALRKVTVKQESYPAPGSRKGTFSYTGTIEQTGGATLVGGGDKDINSKSGRTTSWDITVSFAVNRNNKRAVDVKTTYTATEDAKNNTKLQIVKTQTITPSGVQGDIVTINNGASLHGSGKINGSQHDWCGVWVSGLEGTQIKIDGKGDDAGNVAFKFNGFNFDIPYTY
jgi:hypothetical protein